jgi:hypothetical protein
MSAASSKQLAAEQSHSGASTPPADQTKASDQKGGGSWIDRGLGILQAGVGVVEVGVGVVGGVLSSETVVGAVAGGVVAAHGVDDIQAGVRQAWTGKPTETVTQKAVTSAVRHAGAPPAVAAVAGIVVDTVAGGGVGGAEKTVIKGTEAVVKGVEAAKNVETAAKEVKAVEKGVQAAKDAETAVKGGEDTAKLATEADKVGAGAKGGAAQRLRDPETGRFVTDPAHPRSPHEFTDAQRRAAWKKLAEDPKSPLTDAEKAQIRERGGRGPQRPNPETGETETMELSHEPVPLRDGGTEVVPRWPADHARVDPHRHLKKP